MIALWDDHEFADNSWYGGANNHRPDSQGDWSVRRGAAIQACYEWLPVSEEPWKDSDRQSRHDLPHGITPARPHPARRTPHAEPAELTRSGDLVAALKAYRDGAWADPSATIMGSTQES